MGLSVLRLLAVACLIMLVSVSSASPVSGVYVQKFDDGILFIQIVKTPDGKVSGRGELISMLPNGNLKSRSFSLEGATDGDQISLKANVVLGWGTTLSGTVDGETLQLISGKGQVTLVKSNLNAFAEEKSKLSAKGATIARAKQNEKFQAEAKDYLEKLTSASQSLEVNLSKLPQFESDADNFIAQTKQRRDNIVNQIKVLRAKLEYVSSNDGGEVESIIRGLVSELEGLKSEFDANANFVAISYDKLKSGLENFNSRCDKWVTMYSPTLPSHCSNYQTYLASYQSSRANMRYRYNEAGKMFVFN